MPGDGFQRAADARFVISDLGGTGVLVAIQEWDANSESAEADCSNTEGLPGHYPLVAGGLSGTRDNCRSYVGDIPRVSGFIRNASFAREGNPFVTVSLRVSRPFTLTYYPSGLDGPQYGPWLCLCTRVNHKGFVGQGMQPLTIFFTSDGEEILECVFK
jgi:hypothetical protein